MEWALIIAGIVGLVMAAAGKGTQGPGQNEAEAPTPVYEPEGSTPALPEHSHVEFRPKTLVEYIDQADMKKVIEVEIVAAKTNGAPFPHTLLTGPAGLGKTSIASVIANEMGVPFYSITGPAVANPRAFSLLGVEIYNRHGGVIFIDEAHKIPRDINELFYPLLEDFRFSGTSATGEVATYTVAPFTCMLATTNPSAIAKPLRERCGLHFHLELYKDEELSIIIEHALGALAKQYLPGSIAAFSFKQSAITELAQNACGVPRRAIRLANNCFSYLQYIKSTFLDVETVKKVLSLHGIAPGGLERLDLEILRFLEAIRAPGSGERLPCGLSRLASAINEGREDIEEAEGLLLRRGYIAGTPKGRIITDAGLEYLKQLKVQS